MHLKLRWARFFTTNSTPATAIRNLGERNSTMVDFQVAGEQIRPWSIFR